MLPVAPLEVKTSLQLSLLDTNPVCIAGVRISGGGLLDGEVEALDERRVQGLGIL